LKPGASSDGIIGFDDDEDDGDADEDVEGKYLRYHSLETQLTKPGSFHFKMLNQ
jgi:hypothetical protein